MGVIDIRPRSATLGNLGAVHRVDTGNGAETMARAWQSLGAGVGDLGNSLTRISDIALRIRAREDQRQIDGAIAEATRRMDEAMLTVGNDGVARGLKVEAAEAQLGPVILPRFDKAYSKVTGDVRKELGLTDSQFETFERAMANRRNGWRAEIARTAANTYLASENARAVERANNDFANLARKDVLTEGDLRDYVQDVANPAFMRAKGLTEPETARAYAMGQISKLRGEQAKKLVTEMMAGIKSAGTYADREALYKVAVEELKGEDFSILPAGFEREHFTEEARESLREAMLSDLETGFNRMTEEYKRGVSAAFEEAQSAILAIPVPEDGDSEGIEEYYRNVANGYRRLIASDPDVTSGDNWIKEDLKRFAPVKVNVALRAINSYENRAGALKARRDAAEEREAGRAAKEAEKASKDAARAAGAKAAEEAKVARRLAAEAARAAAEARRMDEARVKENGDLLLRAFVFGVQDQKTGEWRQLSAHEKDRMSDYLFANGDINLVDYQRCRAKVREAQTPFAKAFLREISRDAGEKFPKVVKLQEQLMQYSFTDTAEGVALSAAKTEHERKFFDSKGYEQEEKLLYCEYVDAANAVLASYLARGVKPGETMTGVVQMARDEFLKAIKGTNDGIYRLSIRRINEINRENAESLRNTFRKSLDVKLPAGIVTRESFEKQSEAK